MTRSTLSRAPSNIALVKYMGKRENNIPENPSLSLTLNELCSFAEAREAAETRFVPETPEGAKGASPKLDNKGAERILAHAQRVLEHAPDVLSKANLEPRPDPGRFELRTSNSFPASAGIASSASSFAAVTLAMTRFAARDLEAFEKAWNASPALRRALARVSREGSGSSCRSFEGPFVRWDGETAQRTPSKLPELAHFVLLISAEKKEVGSSEAHRRVRTSPLWIGRPERARARCEALAAAISEGDFKRVARAAWLDAWEMHSLFHTSDPPFSYWKPATIDALHALTPHVHEAIVTMDAGPNLHVIVEKAKQAEWREKLVKLGHPLLEDSPGTGAT